LPRSPDPRTCRFTHSRAVRSCPADPDPGFWGNAGKPRPQPPKKSLRPPRPPPRLPHFLLAPQLVPTPHHKSPTQEKIAPPHLPPLPILPAASTPAPSPSPIRCPSRMQRRAVPEKIVAPPPHLPPFPSRYLYASTKPPYPRSATHPDSGTPKKQSLPASAPHLRTDPHFLLATHRLRQDQHQAHPHPRFAVHSDCGLRRRS
jgi:hypothetical protein